MHVLTARPVRVQRNPSKEDIERGTIWCEWMGRGYHLAAFAPEELAPLPEEQWPPWTGA